MQIVIPMSGFGERFRRAGYTVPKPLIEIDGKTIIEHVVDMFPGETNFTFIVNQDHLDNPSFGMEAELRRLAPEGKILPIAPHKLGPINAVMQAISILDLNEPTIVNYCDFTCLWDWENFKSFVKENHLKGCLPAYRGFHPHSLGTTNYAYIRETNGKVQDIQEKQPFTENRMNEFASSGTYFFSSGQLMKEAFEYVLENNLDVNGEYYVSMAYKYLMQLSAETFVYPLQHFMQWGTPEDVQEYERWSKTFRNLIRQEAKFRSKNDVLVMPMAGLGKRFSDEGYSETKPLIKVSGKPMVIQSANSLPKSVDNVFVLRKDMPGYKDVEKEIGSQFKNAVFEELSKVNDGQARTIESGVEQIPDTGSIVVGACDNGLIFDDLKYQQIIDDKETDVLVWVTRGHTNAIRFPKMYGWARTIEDRVTGVSVKEPLDDPASDPIVIGTMTFKSKSILQKSLQSLFKRNGKINGEFYLDSLIDDAIRLGYNVKQFEVESYISWGTPNDLRTFQYWQSCFHFWPGHPYKYYNDIWVDAEASIFLSEELRLSRPEIVAGALVEK